MAFSVMSLKFVMLSLSLKIAGTTQIFIFFLRYMDFKINGINDAFHQY